MFGVPEVAAVLAGGHDTGPGAVALKVQGLLRSPGPYASHPSHLLVDCHSMSLWPRSVDEHGASFCNLGQNCQSSEEFEVIRSTEDGVGPDEKAAATAGGHMEDCYFRDGYWRLKFV